MYIHVESLVMFVVFKVQLVFWFRGHLCLEDFREKILYSRLGMPVVYTPKNLRYALAFSDFVWDYFSGHYKMRGQIVIKKKSREWTGKKCSCIGGGWILSDLE